MDLRASTVGNERAPYTTQDIEALIASKAQAPLEWSEPTQFDLTSWADQREVARRFADGRIDVTIDRVDEIADDLFEMYHPDGKADTVARRDFIDDIKSQGPGFGSWFDFSWKRSLVRYPDQQDLQGLQTFRNLPLIPKSGQEELSQKSVGIAGLSVGSHVLEQFVLSGIGGTIATGDADTLSPSNLNRLRATMAQVGMYKLDIAACKVSEADPYVEQVHFRSGITPDSLPRLAELELDILVDAVDNLPAKVMLRRFAKEQGIPLIMATDSGDKSLIDVERYDLGDTELFNSQLSSRDIDQLEAGNLTPAEKMKLTIKLVGLRNITPRLLEASMEIGETIGGIPQLGTTATTGGALAAVAGREILLGRKLPSGRYTGSPKQILELQSDTSLSESVAIFRRFIKQRRQ